ncbi:hypothetical protein, variant 1 [Cladophialophora immunda]|uniref:Methyltransferase domain-containing protein n=1 Tax=Cladophialophora immunda TaxID=569365 RepID=A0A0D2C9B7_9EURO|nr:hypothetical protein, variant 1 [Cladophialophora immunda]KIW27718.1 hypothetical protein, variant 1 [Cladophialophora immunda]
MMADQPADEPHVAVEDLLGDVDSAYGGDEIASYTSSLSYSATDYKWEHGRRYHSFREGTYNFPNDEQEQKRYDIMHEVFLTAMDGQHFLAPLNQDLGRILDVGTGTGIWAIQIGDMFPSAIVIGNDLSPIQPQWVPPNVRFEVDDVESEWQYSQPFDFVHCRYMAGSIADWPRLMSQCYNHLKPGGWVEFQDFDLRNYSQDDSIPPDNKVLEWYNTLLEGCERIGRTASPGQHLKSWIQDAGFVNVHQKIFKLPLGAWPKDERMKRVGALNLFQLLEGLEGLTLALFTRALGWSPEAIHAYLVGVRQDAMKKRVHMIHDL